MTIPRRTLLAFAVASVLSTAARANREDIHRPLEQLYAALQDAMRKGQAVPFPERFAALAPVIDKVYDLETVLRVSVGLRWASITGDSRTKLKDAFRKFTVASFVANFDKFDGEKFEVLPGTRIVGADEVVRTRIFAGNGEPIRLDYVMQPSNTGWRIVDVLMDGSISRVAVQRSDFRALLTSGNAEALTENLLKKTAALSGGTIGP